MADINPLYNTNIQCPVCEKTIDVTKVRSKFVRMLRQDEDFCPHYETWNPLLYEAWICSHCGYAAHSSIFEELDQYDKQTVMEKISPKWTSRTFTGERDREQALDAFKIVLYNLQVRGAPPSEFAKVCLRIAWIYRYIGEWTSEYKFMKYSFEYYKRAYTDEHLPNGKLDEYSCMYIIGELGRRLELYDESMLWFGKLISASTDPKQKQKISPVVLQNTQDLIHDVRMAMKNHKSDKDTEHHQSAQ